MPAGSDLPQQEGRWTFWTAVMMIVSLATLVQSYVAIKLFFVALFLFVFLMNMYVRRARILVYPRLVWFYLLISVAAVAWALVGLLHRANYVRGVLDALRLYVVWSAAFVILYMLLRVGSSLRIMHTAVVVAGILIPLINFVGLYDQYSGLGLISDRVRQELDMGIGFHDGYIQITSQNLDLLFLIVPYLLSLQFRADAGKSNSVLTKLALLLSLIMVVVSGRRALWLLVALTPFTILLLSWFTGGYGLMKVGARRFLLVCAVASVAGLGTLLILPESGQDVGSINRFRQAFSSEDERTIQAPYLINGFLKSPVFGSGFGAYAGYQRSEERPWNYELTYHKILFNMGIVGTAYLLTLFCVYLFFVIRLLRRFKNGSAIPFALLIAFCSMVMGAFSNPYFGSFDLLFFGGLLPYLSTFEHGFDLCKLTARAAV